MENCHGKILFYSNSKERLKFAIRCHYKGEKLTFGDKSGAVSEDGDLTFAVKGYILPFKAKEV